MENSLLATKWELEMWEQEPNKSWAEKEYRDLPSDIELFVRKKIEILKKRTLNELISLGDIIQMRGIHKLNISVKRNEVRMFGVIEEASPEKNQLPKFQVLHVFHKKSQKVKKKDIDLALSRYEVFKEDKKSSI